MQKQKLLQDIESYQGTMVSKELLEEIIEDIPEGLLDIPQMSYDEIHDCLFKELELYARELRGENPRTEYVILPLVTYLIEKYDSLDISSESIKTNF